MRKYRRFQDRRRLSGISQADLAEMLSTHQTVISKIENYGPKTDREHELADEMDDLLPPLTTKPGYVTDAEIAALQEWLDERIATSEGARLTVAMQMRSRLRDIQETGAVPEEVETEEATA